MCDNGDPNNWRSKQSWIKDVLSKSGTELMEISATNSATNATGANTSPTLINQNKNAALKTKAKKNGKESQNKMVYYQSVPLIIKTEQASQAQFCTPPAPLHHPPLPQLSAPQNYSLNNGAVVLHQQAPHHQPQTPSINSAHLSQSQNFLTNIKTELLQPSLTLYANPTGQLPAAAPVPAARKPATGNKPQFKCEQCGMTFGSKSAHTSHTKSHANSGDVSSSALSQAQVQAVEVNEAGIPVGIPKTPQIKPHASGVAGGDPYKCNVCQKTFAVPARLIRHYRTHTGERPFECEFCHKLFSVKENLQVHRRIHTKERPYKCNVCDRAFEHSGKLHRHMRIHTGERPHKCSVCEKTFIQSGQLVIHMRTHTGEKPYKCPVEGCGKGFTCSKQLKVHSRTHTGEKPYHCDICFRDFGYNHVLKLHRVQHYGSKCYKCTICDETFKSKKEMEAHIKGHANEMPDDEEETATNGNGVVSSGSSGSGGETTSAPGSPINPPTQKARKPKQQLNRPASPSSPSSTLSPGSSMASATRLSAGSPTSSIASPPLTLKQETEQYSHDAGVNYLNAMNAANNHQQQTTAYHNEDDMPTDLSIPTHDSSHYYKPAANNARSKYNAPQEHTPQSAYSYVRLSPVPLEQSVHMQQSIEPPTINPALLEAATIRRALLEPREEEVTQAALQIMQLHRSQQQQQHHQQQQHLAKPAQHALLMSNNDLSQYDDTREANELIEHYKRGDLARHGIHKGYAPVPKFESSLHNNEIIVRTVEAALAPLRSSTESPERSSSPESDSMMMADRDVMTLPLRKRKLYMSEGPSEASVDHSGNTSGAANAAAANGGANSDAKVMRMSSVIQFAKAS